MDKNLANFSSNFNLMLQDFDVVHVRNTQCPFFITQGVEKTKSAKKSLGKFGAVVSGAPRGGVRRGSWGKVGLRGSMSTGGVCEQVYVWFYNSDRKQCTVLESREQLTMTSQ